MDAYLYLNRPGVSGAGSCNGGQAAGVWWPERALMYAKYATQQVGLAWNENRVPAADLPVQARSTGQRGERLQLGLARESLPVAGTDGFSRFSGGFAPSLPPVPVFSPISSRSCGRCVAWPSPPLALLPCPRPPRPRSPCGGLPFSVSKVPNLERDCGRTAATVPTQPADPRGVSPAAANPLRGRQLLRGPHGALVQGHADLQGAWPEGQGGRHRQTSPCSPRRAGWALHAPAAARRSATTSTACRSSSRAPHR